ncbi:MAG: hypothetical protein JOZ53_23320 [Planctomycetaceae bacterium]|nr:hypothetical protein [Planctomycetaceae bacterium]
MNDTNTFWTYRLVHPDLMSPLLHTVIDGEPYVEDHPNFGLDGWTHIAAREDGVLMTLGAGAKARAFFPCWWLAEDPDAVWDFAFLRRQLLAAHEAGERSSDRSWYGRFRDLGIENGDAA